MVDWVLGMWFLLVKMMMYEAKVSASISEHFAYSDI